MYEMKFTILRLFSNEREQWPTKNQIKFDHAVGEIRLLGRGLILFKVRFNHVIERLILSFLNEALVSGAPYVMISHMLYYILPGDGLHF